MYELPPLPYEATALAPVISADTLGFHHGKHHKTYVDTLNELLKEHKSLASLSLEDLIRETYGNDDLQELFNNAAQTWNHTFYWNSMRPDGGGKPGSAVKDRIEKDFGSQKEFEKEFSEAATTQFGSGWAWLVEKDGKLAVTKTPDAVNPLALGQKPLLTVDVWEHAYYLDYQNRRPDYIQAWLDKLANWEFVERNLG